MGTIKSTKSFADRFAEYERKRIKDFDPENDERASNDGGNSWSGDSDNEGAETEHYVSVDQSKLGQKEPVYLGPAYRGTRVSRAALESDGEQDDVEGGAKLKDDNNKGFRAYDEPDTAYLMAENVDENADFYSEKALIESEQERFKTVQFKGSAKHQLPEGGKRLTAPDFETSSGESKGENSESGLKGDEEEDDEGMLEPEAKDSNSDSEEGSEEKDDDGGGGFFGDEEEEEEEEGNSEDSGEGVTQRKEKKTTQKDARTELCEMFDSGQKHVATTIAASAKSDAEKGVAVGQQRRVFDLILNIRIRLQKALVAANSLLLADNSEEIEEKTHGGAEEALVQLWDTLDQVRNKLHPDTTVKTGEKRKRGLATDSSINLLWERMEVTEETARAYRRKVLDKWSGKVNKSNAAANARQLKDTPSQSLVSVLDDQLLNADRLIQRTRIPRSCAPVQAARKVGEDANVYDDADFYQLLLKGLVDQRSGDLSAPGSSVTTIKWMAVAEAKTRKQVDRRVSKGRKLRYTVHEKLRNLMAPDDRRAWEQHAIDSFFGALFGQRLGLKEDEKEASDNEMGGTGANEAGLKLFRR